MVSLECGQIVKDTYRIVRKLGDGGEGSVYLTIHERTYGLWAMKVVPQEKVSISESEIMYRMQLSHPGLPKITDIWNEDRKWYFVMEYIFGKTLEEINREQGKISGMTAVGWAEQLCEILQYLHVCNPPIIYGDMKPANVICQEDGRLVLTDFGSMRRLGSGSGIVTGTKGYAAPEQYLTNAVLDQRTDIYSLGITLKKMLGDQNSGRKSNLEQALWKIAGKCTQKQKESRYASCEELKRALQHVRKKRRPPLLIAIAVSVFLMTIAVLAVEQKHKSDQEVNYRKYCISNDISKIKSAIILNPYRDEAYQKLLEQILEDAVMDQEEEAQIRQILGENEEYLQQNKKPYAEFAYQLGLAYWYYFSGYGGKKRAAAWFEKAWNEELLPSGEQRRCLAFVTLGKVYDYLDGSNILTGKEIDFQDIWRYCCQIGETETEDTALALQIWKEVLGIQYTCLTEFISAGITVKELEEMINVIEKKAAVVTVENQTAEKLQKEVIEKCGIMKDAINNMMKGINECER